MSRRTASTRMCCAVRVAVEHLEDRRLLAGDPLAFQNVVQTLPFALSFTQQVNGVFDASGQSIGFTRVQVNRLGTQYQPSLLNLNTAAGELDVTTAGNAISGSNYGTDNTQVDALETQFNATTSGFSITARLKGPLSNLSTAYDGAGVYFGPDQDNYVKLVAEYDATRGQILQFTDEQGATIHTVNVLQNIGSFSALTTLDLRLTGDAVTGRVSGSYSVNGGAFTSLGQFLQLTGSEAAAFFNAAGRAGILAAQKNNLAPVTVGFSHFEIDPGAAASGRPAILSANPSNGQVGVPVDSSITADLSLPNAGLDPQTLTSGSVQLFRTTDHALVPATVNTSGGGDSIVLQPSSNLAPNTNYTFSVTSGVKDTAGAALVPFTMTFTTGSGVSASAPTVQFQKVALPSATGAPFTCVRMGPDGKLYASTEDGRIFRWSVNADGTLGTPQIITSLQAANGGPRLISGFAFDPHSTATNLVIWVSNGYYATQNTPDWTGKITVMSGPDLGTVQDAVVNLPRSIQDHLTEQPAFGPDGALYFPQGSDTAMGAPDVTWGMRSEHMLSAAILRLDTTRITPGQPLDAKTVDGGGTYNPFAAGAPLTLYATGVRNAFTLLWTANGKLYAPTNGSSAGGNTPAFPNAVNGQRIDTGQPYAGPAVPGLTNLPQAEPDWLFNIVQGGYYGHPDPARGEYVLDGGNPTAGVDPFEITQYPVGTQPDPNYRGATAYSLGAHRSPDGIIEYQDHSFGGRLQGTLMVAEESAGGDIVVLTRDASGNIVSAQRGIPGLTGFQNPVNLAEDPNTGNLYVAELGGMKLTLLRPQVPHATATPGKSLMVFNDIQTSSTGGAGPSPSQTLTITNTGNLPLTFGAGAFQIVNDPSSPTQDAASFAITNLSALPTSVGPGQSGNLVINFTASSVGIKAALLQISSNDPAHPLLTIQLHGIGTTGTGGTNEPSLARILRAYDIPTIVGDGPNDANQGFTLYPNPPDPSSQEVVMQRLVKAGDGPVTITPLAAYAVSNQPALRFGYYTPGNPNDRNELFSVGQADAQTVNPTPVGSTSFDPGANSFGLYTVFPTFTDNGHQRISYSEDAFNTWDTAVQRKMRFFPLENPDGSIVPNAYVFTAEDWNVQYDSNDLVAIIRNVKAAPGSPGAPQLGLENLDVLPASDRMIFNRIQNPNPAVPGGADIVHDTGTLRLHNTGGSALVISGIAVNGPWVITNMPAAGTSIAPGGTLDLNVKFVATGLPPSLPYNETNDITSPTGGGAWSGSLVISSNDPNQPTKTVTLAGWWQNQSEHEDEPGIQTIVNLLAGWQTIISANQQPELTEGATTPTYYGEEVVSPFWQRADASLPVTVRQLDSFHSQLDTTQNPAPVTSARVGWYPQGASLSTWLYSDMPGAGQSFFPHISGSNAQSVAGFNPTGVFGLNLDGNYSDDTRNTVGGGGGHHVRFYPLRDSSGNLVPNTWIVALDYGSTTFENYDFQDNIYIISNMRPANKPAAPTDASASANPDGSVTLQWAAVSDSTLAGYNVYRSSSATGTFLKVNTSPVTATSFVDQYASAGVTTYYRVTAVDASGESSADSASVMAVPAAPTSLAAIAVGAGQIRLTWLPSAGNVTYRVERVALGGGSFVQIAGGLTSNSFTNSNLLAGTTYVYQVRAENGSGLSPYSAIATATTPSGTAPTAPSGLGSSLNGSGQVVLSWTASAGTVTAYHVERATAGGAFVEIAGNVQGLTFTDTTVAPGTAYSYRVRAENGGLFSGYSATTGITTPASASAPPAPTSLVAQSASSSSITLTWTAPAGSVTDYRVYRKGPTDSTFVQLPGTVTTTGYTDTGLAAATAYQYQVVAENAAGLSPASNIASATTSSTQPIDPFSSQDIGAAQPGSTTVVTPGVDYNVVAGGPAIYGTADGFRFLYQPVTGNFDLMVRVQSLAISAGGTLPQAGLMARETLDPGSPDVFIGASLTNGFRFKYRTTPGGTTTGLTAGTPAYPGVFVRLVRSGSTFTAYYSADGVNWTRYSAVSESLPSTLFVGMAVVADSATTLATAQLRGYGPTQQVVVQPPAAPASLDATAVSPTQVNLAWAAVAGATSYHVERSTAGGSFVEIAASVTGTSYNDTTAQPGTAYQYRVRAQNSAGLGGYSPVASATTPTAAPVDPLTSLDIGASPAGSTTVITPGSDYDMTAGGPAIYGTADGFRFDYEQITGNFDLKVRINSISVAGAIAQAGLMARATLDASSPEVAVTASPASGYRFKYRTTTGGATTPANTIGTCSYPNVWVRLQRVGNVLTGYFSTDGVTWTSTGSVTLALPTTIYVGLAAASNDSTDLTTVQFRGFGNT